jgi:hypothetical protein
VAPSAPARHALVIGNSRYLQAPLRNPANDARAVAQRLRAAGFEVVEQLDAGRDDMHRSIREFAQTLGRTRGVGVFYYAGHGVQLNWRNFLVPVDARIRARADLQSQAVDLGLLLDQLGQARKAANLIILDACRDNPFGPDFRVDDKGLSQIDAPPGTLLAYATAPGNVADDGPDDNGLYTGSLLREMSTEGAAIEDVFKRVRLSVRRASRGAQIPWESTSLESDFSFVPSSVPRDAAREFDEDLARWMGLRSSSSVDELEAFIRQREPGATRIEVCHTDSRIVLRRGWTPLRDDCVAEPGDEVLALRFTGHGGPGGGWGAGLCAGRFEEAGAAVLSRCLGGCGSGVVVVWWGR